MNDIIRVTQVSKYFGGVKAVNDVSFSVSKGTILGVVGPDGAGKTTLLRLMTGVLRKYDGQIVILDSLNNVDNIKEKLGYMPQRFSLYQDLTVMENIKLLGALYGLSEAEIFTKSKEILNFVGLWEFGDRLAGKLSGGMKQKLALAAAIMHEPEILFLDEPTTGVDPVARREFWQLLYGLNKKGITIIAATPYMDEAELCHLILLMNEGRGIRCQSPAEIIDSYPYTVLELASSERGMPQILEGCYFSGIDFFSDTYHIVTDNAERTWSEVIRRLDEAGITAPTLRVIKPSLEDAFILFAEERER